MWIAAHQYPATLSLRQFLLVTVVVFAQILCLSSVIARTDTVNVKDYGALGDDQTDDIAAFEAAVNALQEWQTLYIPQGQYRLSRKLVIRNKHRTNIVGEGVIKPFGQYDDFLIQITNDAQDPIVPSMGLQINIRGLKLDCEWKSRGIEISKIYDSTVQDLEVWRPYGTGISTPMLQEVTFIKPLIVGARPRFNMELLRAPEWNRTQTYQAGSVVRRSHRVGHRGQSSEGTWSADTWYAVEDIVVHNGHSYRCLKANRNRSPADLENADYWERIPPQYFVATGLGGNRDRDPWDHQIDNTARQARAGVSRFWIPVFPDEAAWAMVGTGKANTIDNVKIWNFISRSNATPVVLRIDNTEHLPPQKIELYAPQLHAITKQYIAAFNRGKYSWTIDDKEEVLNNGRLIEVLSSGSLKIFGGQLRVANVDYMKGMLIGTPGKTGHNARMVLVGTSLEGAGNGQVLMSLQRSSKFYGRFYAVANSPILRGRGSRYRNDPSNETRKHQGSAIVFRGTSSVDVRFPDSPTMSLPTVHVVPKSELRGLTYHVTNISNNGFTLNVAGLYAGPIQKANFGGMTVGRESAVYVHDSGVPVSSLLLGGVTGEPGERYRAVMSKNDGRVVELLVAVPPTEAIVQDWWVVWENKAPVDLEFTWYVDESER
jgi:hypothetical protein